MAKFNLRLYGLNCGLSLILLSLLSGCEPILVPKSVPIQATISKEPRPTFPVGTQLIVEPYAHATPYLHAIAAARSRIDVEMYELTDFQVEQALMNAALRGVQVRVLLDKHPYDTNPARVAQTANRLQQGGVQVRFAPSRFPYDHAKTMVVDGKVAFIGSANFTYSGLDTNREYDVETSDAAVAAAVSAVFEADWTGQKAGIGPCKSIVLSPGAQAVLLPFMAAAKSTLDVETEEVPDAQVAHVLETDAHRGVNVTLIEAETNETDHGWGARELANLAKQGVHVEILHRPYLHAKLILADGQAFIGSENLSAPSLERNREVGIFLSNSELVEQLRQQFDSDSAVALAPNRV